MKTGIVMEGGAMRGMFTCGVLDVFMEKGITFDGAVGVSAGATFGINLKSRQIGRAYRYNKKYCNDKRYHSMESLLRTGDIFNVKFCYSELPFKLDLWDYEAFESNPMEFYCVATDLKTGGPVYHRCDSGMGKDMEWIRASASMPIVSRPVKIDGGVYLDGGAADSIPLKFMEDQGYDRILVIETQPADYVKGKQKYMPLIKMNLRKYPNAIRTLENRHMMYNEEKRYIREKEKLGEVLVIRPKAPLAIKPTESDHSEIERVYKIGREAGEEFLKESNWVSDQVK